MEYLVFKRSELTIGIEIEYIQQVVDDVTVAPVPFTSSGYAGLIYYRGRLFDVVDLGIVLAKREPIRPNGNLNILLIWNQKGIALAADEILGLRSSKEDASQTRDGAPERIQFQIITPERIWKMLSELPYGPGQV